jgi:hypothetical protein
MKNSEKLIPLALDFDGSLEGLTSIPRIELGNWQEAIRFGCSRSTWQHFRNYLEPRLPRHHGTVLMGSGDFHHISHLLLQHLETPEPVDVVVFDNHPDNMRFPFGIHCGSWVRHASLLPKVNTIHVVGICSPDVSLGRAWENYLLPLYRGKVRYWTLGVDTRWIGSLGRRAGAVTCATAEELIKRVTAALKASGKPIYLSIDKDVLDPSVAHTNWDQGRLDLAALEYVIAALAGRLVGSDITGEVSLHRYQTRWKRWLSARDEQPLIGAERLAEWQAQQTAVNQRLLASLAAATVS